MIIADDEFDVQISWNSKFIIQPFINTNNYLIADVTNPTLDTTKYTSKFQFYQHSSFIHLSNSLVVAGGNNSGNILNSVI